MKTNLKPTSHETSEFLTVEDVSSQLNVTSMTVKNWINAGLLEKDELGKIPLQSYETFKNQFVGKNKLTKRANKLFLDDIDVTNLKLSFLEKIVAQKYDGGQLAQEYAMALGQSYKNAHGIFYTPQHIVREMLEQTLEAPPLSKTLCDPCCGAGNFLTGAIDLGFQPQNLYGLDTDPVAVELTKYRIFQKTGYQTANIICADSLLLLNQKNPTRYDLVFTNPPWGNKISKKNSVDNGPKLDSSAIFAKICLEITKEGGFMGLLLPEAFFNIASYVEPRKLLLSKKILSMTDYGKVFKGLQTRAQAIILKNALPLTDENSTSPVRCNHKKFISTRDQSDFSRNPDFIFNFHIKTKESQALDIIFDAPHATLKSKAQWALGIVTGDNRRFISETPKENYLPVFRGSDVQQGYILPPTRYILKNFSRFQQVAPIELYRAPQKIVYRFICDKLILANDDCGRLFLNSANMFIPDLSLEIPNQTLCQYFNSPFVNWIFHSIFKTHKILRKDLERLPIFTEFLRYAPSFEEEKLCQSLGLKKTEEGRYAIK